MTEIERLEHNLKTIESIYHDDKTPAHLLTGAERREYYQDRHELGKEIVDLSMKIRKLKAKKQ